MSAFIDLRLKAFEKAERSGRILKPEQFQKTRTAINDKIRESFLSVLPIVLIVTVLCLCISPMKPDLLVSFLVGALMIVIGMGLFSLGAEQSAIRSERR